MAIKKQMCISHPDRMAIGVCVITGQAICAECSTRYEGVNYSREGLRIMQQRRAAGEGAGRGVGFVVLATLTTPLMIGILYFVYLYVFQAIIDYSLLES